MLIWYFLFEHLDNCWMSVRTKTLIWVFFFLSPGSDVREEKKVQNVACVSCGLKFHPLDMCICQSDTDKSMLVCRSCQSALLQQSLGTKAPIKPFRCSVCAKLFQFDSYLQRHMKTHSDVKPFVCSGCGKGYKHSSHMKTHMRACAHVTLVYTEETASVNDQTI